MIIKGKNLFENYVDIQEDTSYDDEVEECESRQISDIQVEENSEESTNEISHIESEAEQEDDYQTSEEYEESEDKKDEEISKQDLKDKDKRWYKSVEEAKKESKMVCVIFLY